MSTFVYTAKTAYNKKKTKMPDQTCANGLQLHDIPQDLQHIMPLERIVISPQIPSFHTTHHETIWWPLQSKWSTCQCSSNTRSNYRDIADIKQIESDATLAIMLSQRRTLQGHKITAGQL